MKVVLFLVTFIIYHIIGSNFFPVSEDNVLLAPDWYPILGLCISFSVTYLVSHINKKEKRKKSNRSVEDTIESNIPIKETKNINSSNTGFAYLTPEGNNEKSFVVNGNYDELLPAAVDVVLETGQASVSMLQRRLHLSYSRAARIIDEMETHGLIGEFNGTNPRKVYIFKNHSIYFLNSGSAKSDNEKFLSSDFNNEFLMYGGVNAELLTVDLMDGHSFEHWCASVLLKNGFSSAEVTPGSGDHGVDVVAVKDEVRYAIQCKCYHSDLGNTPVQEVYAGKEMYGCQVGVVMTNRYFTKGAKELAEKTKVLLWDRDKLAALIESAEKDF